MVMKCLFAYNPISGKGKAAKRAGKIAAKLSERFGEVSVRATTRAGELKDIAAEACGKYDLLVFAGGDGSFNEVVNGLAERENRPALGYIPTGTVNDIARSAGIPRSIGGALKNILRGEPRELDLLIVHDSFVMYVACCGGLTGCSYSAPQSGKRAFGKMAYAAEIIKNDLVFDEYEVEFSSGDKSEDASAIMVMIMNGRSVASMRVNPGGVLDDGEAEVLIIKGYPRENESEHSKHRRYLFSALKVFTRGYKRLSKSGNVFSYKGGEFEVRVPDNTVWNFDGEKGESGSVSVRVLNKHIKMILPISGK